MPKTISLKDKIKELEGDLAQLQHHKAPHYQIKKLEVLLTSLYNKRDEIFKKARENKRLQLQLSFIKKKKDEMEGRPSIKLKDMPVEIKETYVKPKKVHSNVYWDDMRGNMENLHNTQLTSHQGNI